MKIKVSWVGQCLPGGRAQFSRWQRRCLAPRSAWCIQRPPEWMKISGVFIAEPAWLWESFPGAQNRKKAESGLRVLCIQHPPSQKAPPHIGTHVCTHVHSIWISRWCPYSSSFFSLILVLCTAAEVPSEVQPIPQAFKVTCISDAVILLLTLHWDQTCSHSQTLACFDVPSTKFRWDTYLGTCTHNSYCSYF